MSAQTRIMLISDPHVMGPGLLISEGAAWEEAVLYDRKLNDYSRALYDEAIAIALREKPDLFLIPGDLTKDGELLSHQYVAGKLQELKAAGIKAFVIPGNHDFGTTETLYYDGDDAWPAETVNAPQFAELYADFGYGASSQIEPTTLTYSCEPVDGLVLIGIDTGHDGSRLNGVISDATLDWVCRQASQASAAGKRVLVMMHHSLFPHVNLMEKVSSTYVVKYGVKGAGGVYDYRDAATIRDRLVEAGVRVVFTGHVHATDIGKDTDSRFSYPIYDVCTATLAACPNPYRLMTLNNDMSRLGVSTGYITALSGTDDFAALAESRMVDGLVTLGMQFTHEKDIARLGADIFLMHVKGNEHKADKRDEYLQMYYDNLSAIKADRLVRNMLEAYQMTLDELDEIVHGILDDKTNYGDPKKESQVDDLRLTLDLVEKGWTDVGSAVRQTAAADDDRWYTLQGVRLSQPRRPGLYVRNGRLVVRH